MTTATTARPASESQVDLIHRLFNERVISDTEAIDRLLKLLKGHDLWVTTDHSDGAPIPFANAGPIITWLLKQPRSGDFQMPKATAPARNDTPAEVGVYRHDGDIYVVREFTPQGEDRKVKFARKIVALRDGQADRLNGAGAKVRYQEAKAPGMQYSLKPAELLSIDEVSALSVEWEHCIVCGHGLEVAESVERGIGPVCFKRQTAALALVMAAA